MLRFQHRWKVVFAITAIGAAASAGFISNGHASPQPPPGLTAGVASLTALPVQANIPTGVSRFINSAAAATGTDAAAAHANVRLLRTNLGSSSRSVYAFRNANGSPCFLLTGVAGTCARTPAGGTPGLHWTLGGGTDETPSSLVGIASDDVSAVDLFVDGRPVLVTRANNVVYAEFPRTAKEAHVVIHRSGGVDNSFHVRLQG